MRIQGLITYYFLFPKTADTAFPLERNLTNQQRSRQYKHYKSPYDKDSLYPIDGIKEDVQTAALYNAVSDFLRTITDPETPNFTSKDKASDTASTAESTIVTTKNKKRAHPVLSVPTPPQLYPQDDLGRPISIDPETQETTVLKTANTLPLINYTFSILPRNVNKNKRLEIIKQYTQDTANIDLRAYSLIIEATPQLTPEEEETYLAPEKLTLLKQDLEEWLKQLTLIDLLYNVHESQAYQWPEISVKYEMETKETVTDKKGRKQTRVATPGLTWAPHTSDWDRNRYNRTNDTPAYKYIINDKEQTRTSLSNAAPARRRSSYYNYYSTPFPHTALVNVHVSDKSFIRLHHDTTDFILFHQFDPEEDFMSNHKIASYEESSDTLSPQTTKLVKAVADVNEELKDVTLKERK